MTPRTCDYLDPEPSYDQSSETNGKIFQKLKMEKISLKDSPRLKS